MVCQDHDEQISQEEETSLIDLNEPCQLNYMRFKEFLMTMGLLTMDQSLAVDSVEGRLVTDAWILAPKHIESEVELEQNQSENESEEFVNEYINLLDLKVIIMTILRLNDGRTFIEHEDSCE